MGVVGSELWSTKICWGVGQGWGVGGVGCWVVVRGSKGGSEPGSIKMYWGGVGCLHTHTCITD